MKRQDIAAGGLLIIDGKALVIRRAAQEQSSAGYWEFPKGGVEFGESTEDALKREFLEETNLKVSPKSIHAAYSHTYTRDDMDIHFIEIEYLVELDKGQSIDNIKLDSNSHDEWRLVDKAQAMELDRMYEEKRKNLLLLLDTL